MMNILLTKKWVEQSISKICKFCENESSRSAIFRFLNRVWDAVLTNHDVLQAINENSIYEFESISKRKFSAKDEKGDMYLLQITEN